MEAKDLRTLSVDELKGRVKQWGEELFRSRFKAGTAEAKDTSIFKKLRKDIARAQTVMNEKLRSGEVGSTAPAAAAPAAPAPEKKVAKTKAPEDKAVKAEKKPAKKTAKAKE